MCRVIGEEYFFFLLNTIQYCSSFPFYIYTYIAFTVISWFFKSPNQGENNLNNKRTRERHFLHQKHESTGYGYFLLQSRWSNANSVGIQAMRCPCFNTRKQTEYGPTGLKGAQARHPPAREYSYWKKLSKRKQ